ncbi:hypothetical protein C8F04DRAFT_1179616 [Mycena alexandri]|uniref:Uncharacterized protein n=1 Tax=Mycena alexandri TaxID=1745969 RepID=A0AAD6T368_9AGAR|nr:hypothetical protein C8F04DRAFT_1179616 [Mycena alexandri]
MDGAFYTDAEFTSDSATDDSASSSRGGSVFPHSHHFTVAGEFRMIPQGDIDLQHEIRLDYGTGIGNRHRERPLTSRDEDRLFCHGTRLARILHRTVTTRRRIGGRTRAYDRIALWERARSPTLGHLILSTPLRFGTIRTARRQAFKIHFTWRVPLPQRALVLHPSFARNLPRLVLLRNSRDPLQSTLQVVHVD